MDFRPLIREFALLIGLERNTTSHREKLLSALGAAVAIAAVAWITWLAALSGVIAVSTSYFLVASMGASAVLLFAVPHGALSQPWPVLGGHLLSALIGVICATWLPRGIWAAGAAVGAAVGVMYYLRCIHPPGGATALTAVIGGADVHGLGFQYLLFPVLINVLAILLVAVAFNCGFSWRRYPAHLAHRRKVALAPRAAEREFELTQEDFAAAMQELDSYVDVTSEGLTELLELAKRHAERNVVHPAEIRAGKFYSNGKLGSLWSVRQVIDEPDEAAGDGDRIIFKTVAGAGAYATGLCMRGEFRAWARFEVAPQGDHWVKITGEALTSDW